MANERAGIVKSGTEVWFYGSFYFSFVTWNPLDNFPPADSLNNIQHTSREYGSSSKVEPRHLLGKPMTRIKATHLTFSTFMVLAGLFILLNPRNIKAFSEANYFKHFEIYHQRKLMCGLETY